MGSIDQTESANDIINYGRRLTPHVLDAAARDEPEGEIFQIPRTSEPKDGWRVITYKQFANAINHCAYKLVEACGPAPKDTIPTIAYIGPNDARYLIMFVGCMKAGYKALFTSPRNSEEAHMKLFEDTDCQFIAYTERYESKVQPWVQKRGMKPIEIDSLEACFPKKEVPNFPYKKTFEEAEYETAIVLHTSGSTGLPKPIMVTHGLLSIADKYHNVQDWRGMHPMLNAFTMRSKRILNPMPLFHAGGIYLCSLWFFWKMDFALGVSDRPMSADLACEYMEYADIESIILPPVILQDMSHSEEYIAPLAKCNYVVTFGGNISREAGDKLAKNNVLLVNCIAATETDVLPLYFQEDRALWQYFIVNSDLMGADWRKVPGEEDVYELVIVRKAKSPGLQGIFYTFPELNEYSTKDLFRPHPTLPDHWSYYGRSDNIIVFSTGEKLNPITIEELVMSRKEVKGALVVGTDKFQAGLIIEPNAVLKTEDEKKKFIDFIWPTIVKANKETVEHGRITRDFVMLSDPEKPFERAGKGTVQRKATLALYKDEIDSLYERQSSNFQEAAPVLDVSSECALVQSIQDMFAEHMDVKALDADKQFFLAGVDSLQTIKAAKLLRAGLAAIGHPTDDITIAPRVIYNYPTPQNLAQYILSSVVNGKGAAPVNRDTQQVEAMKTLWDKYTKDLVQAKRGRPEALTENQTVVITGTTGMLGSYLLDFMSRNPAVKKVICLNRALDGGVNHQAKAFRERGLVGDYAAKAEFYHADMSRADFGIPPDVFSRLLQEADRFIHNAWPVNFNIPVETFEPHLHGCRNVADFAARASKRVAVAFISSIASADRWDANKGMVPEERLNDLRLSSFGYGSSKMVGSLILDDASKAGDFPLAVIRVGQIAGPEAETGVWNRHEWLPTIVASSLYLKALPSDLGAMSRVDWTPSERIAKLVLEVSGVAQKVDPKDITGYYHGVNPEWTTWKEMAPAVQEFYGKERIPELISFKEWVSRLEASETDDAKDARRNPGVKLLDTYRGASAAAEAHAEIPPYASTRTTALSPTMANSKAITPKLMQRWCKQWGFENL